MLLGCGEADEGGPGRRGEIAVGRVQDDVGRGDGGEVGAGVLVEVGEEGVGGGEVWFGGRHFGFGLVVLVLVPVGLGAWFEV